MWQRLSRKLGIGHGGIRETTKATDSTDCPKGSTTLFNTADAAVDIVLVHDLTESRDEAWKSMRWLSDLPRCRIVAFGYDASGLEKLEDLIDPKRLINCAKALLHDYPLRAPPETSTSSVQGSQEIKKGTAAASYTSIGAEQPADETPDGNGFPVDIGRPALFVAHGFGGLIYEQALSLSYGHDHIEGKRRRHAAILLNTPHYGAGMAEWALMCAKELRIPCADTRQGENWSGSKDSLARIEEMQRLFRVIIRQKVKVNITGCYAARPVPNSNLRLAPEWAVLPDFEPLTVDDNHFGITKLDDEGRRKIAPILEKKVEELHKAIDDEERPKSPDALGDLRRALRYEKPKAAEEPQAADLVLPVIQATKSLITFYSHEIRTPSDVVNAVNKMKRLLIVLERLRGPLNLLNLLTDRKSYASEQDLLESIEGIVRDCRGRFQELQNAINTILNSSAGGIRAYPSQQRMLQNLNENIDNIDEIISPISLGLQMALLWAAANGNEAIVKRLLHEGAAIDGEGNLKRTPLSWAAEKGYEPIVRLLLENGADVKAKDNSGRTPLSYATDEGHENVMLLLNKKAEIERRMPPQQGAEKRPDAAVKSGKFDPHLDDRGEETPDPATSDESPFRITLLLGEDRRHYIGKGQPWTVLARMSQVTHGTLEPDGPPATLIVMKFEFRAPNGHRFKSAIVKVAFRDSGSAAGSLVSIFPVGKYSLKRTTKPAASHTINPSVQAEAAPATAVVEYEPQRMTTIHKVSAALLSGAVMAPTNVAMWELVENGDDKGGIPTLLQTAILLARKESEGNPEDETFKAIVEVEALVDSIGILPHAAKLKGTDEMIFDPKHNKDVADDSDNLSKSWSRVTSQQDWVFFQEIPPATSEVLKE